MRDSALLVQALRSPRSISACDWSALISIARAEQLIGSLAYRFEGVDCPPSIRILFETTRRDFAQQRVQALWEAEMAKRALADADIEWVLLKGTAFHSANLLASVGRSVGDLDILVPKDQLDRAEEALLAAGWERLKPADGYDDQYYRRWMHELPPLIHKSRDRMIDVHHTILPLTARPRPDASALVAGSLKLEGGLRILAPADMIVHAAAHLLADGDLAGGLRNLWDIDQLLREFAVQPGFWADLAGRSRLHQLERPVALALRLSSRLFETPVDSRIAGRARLSDRGFEARLLARNGWGQENRKILRFGFYIRSHWLRMPPHLLARHLWVKAMASRGETVRA